MTKSEIENPKSEIEQIALENTWRLRRDVLYPGHKMFEMEMEEDVNGIHFGAFVGNKQAGVISLFQQGTCFQFRKLAVDIAFERQGIGTALLDHVAKFAVENCGTNIWCNARVTATDFYLKAGYHKTGKLFTKNGIDYEIMEKQLITDQPGG